MKLHVFKIQNGAGRTEGGSLPTRLKLLNWGDNPAILGINPRLGSHTVEKFAARMRDLGLDTVALDFEHNTCPGTPAYLEATEPRPVAAFGVPRLIPLDGLYLEDLQYTPAGKRHALNFIDLSPTVHIDPVSGEVDLLHSVALTRAGAVEGLSYYSIEADITKQAQGDKMDWKKMLIALTGAPDDVADEALQEMFKAKLESISAAAVEPVNVALSALTAAVAKIKPADGQETELTALSIQLATLKDDLAAVTGEVGAMRRQAVCAQAAREGKVIPLSAEQINATDVKVLTEMVGKLPVTVPVDRRTPEHIQTLSAAGMTSALKSVAERCGMDPAKVVEANKPK